ELISTSMTRIRFLRFFRSHQGYIGFAFLYPLTSRRPARRASPKALTLNPGSIDRTPCRRVRALVFEYPRQALLPHAVITVQRRKASDRRRNANCRKTRVRRRGIRPPVIHRRAYRNYRWHLVVQQSAYAAAQSRCDSLVTRIVTARLRAVDAASQ